MFIAEQVQAWILPDCTPRHSRNPREVRLCEKPSVERRQSWRRNTAVCRRRTWTSRWSSGPRPPRRRRRARWLRWCWSLLSRQSASGTLSGWGTQYPGTQYPPSPAPASSGCLCTPLGSRTHPFVVVPPRRLVAQSMGGQTAVRSRSPFNVQVAFQVACRCAPTRGARQTERAAGTASATLQSPASPSTQPTHRPVAAGRGRRFGRPLRRALRRRRLRRLAGRHEGGVPELPQLQVCEGEQHAA